MFQTSVPPLSKPMAVLNKASNDIFLMLLCDNLHNIRSSMNKNSMELKYILNPKFNFIHPTVLTIVDYTSSRMVT